MNIGYDLTVNGDLAVASGATFKVASNTNSVATPNGGIANSLILKGSLTNSSGTVTLRAGTSGTTLSVCNIILLGILTSTLNVPYVSSSNGTFNYITINKTFPGKATLSSDIITSSGSSTGPSVCNSGITFTSGNFETGSYKLAYQGTTATQVTGYSSSSYVNGTFARGMSSTAGSVKDFPVGDANGYRLFNLTSTTSGSATGHLAIVRCITGDANNGSTLSSDIDKVSAVRYYQVSYSNTIGGATSMNFDLFKVSYAADDGVVAGNTDLRVVYSTDARATWNGISQTTPYTTAIAGGDPQSQITPDALGTAVTLASGSSMYVALARVTGTTTNPLPVEMISFAASMQGTNCAMLKWSTATEVNSARFDVERRTVNSSAWTKVGSVNAVGTSNSTKNYIYQDVNLVPGVYVYRIKQIDNDGTFKYSANTQVDAGASKGFELLGNYPNPFNPTTNLNFSVPQDGYASLKVYNVLGQEVATLFNGMAQAGHYIQATFDGSRFASGIYFSHLQYDGKSLVQRMLMMK
jgi:hypothetical protein